MSTIIFLDGNSVLQYRSGSGSGSALDPFICNTNCIQSGSWSTSITGSVAVTGTFWQTTQPVSAASLPLPTGAATQTTLASVLTALGSPFQAGGSIGNTTFASTQSGTWNVATITTVAGVTTVSTVTNLAQMGGAAISMGTGVRGTGTQRITICTDDLVPVSLAAETTKVIGTINLSAAQTLATVTTVGAVTAITNALPAGTNTLGGTISKPATSGGLTLHSLISTGTSGDATSVKGTAGQLYWIYVTNTNAAARWVKIYNTSGTPTAGSGTPVLRLMIPGNTSGAGFTFQSALGLAFSSGIGYTIVTTGADAGATGVAAGDVTINIGYN